MSNAELMCANCGQALDPGDMFCRACGLPTVLASTARAEAVAEAPDLRELERSLDIAPEPAVMERIASANAAHGDTEPLDRVAFAAPSIPRRTNISPLTIVILVALLGAVAVFFLLLSLG